MALQLFLSSAIQKSSDLKSRHVFSLAYLSQSFFIKFRNQGQFILEFAYLEDSKTVVDWKRKRSHVLKWNTGCAVQLATRHFPCFLREFLVKLDFQWQFWNLLVMRILKHLYMLNLMKIWLSYLRLETIDTISTSWKA